MPDSEVGRLNQVVYRGIDNGTREVNFVSDGPQRRTMEERESLRSARGIVPLMHND